MSLGAAHSSIRPRPTMASRPDPLRARPVEVVARTACRLLLDDGAISIRIDNGPGPKLRSVLAALQREYRVRRAGCIGRADAAAWLANLQFAMGLRAIEELSGCLCALFGLDRQDVARRALVLECVGAIANEELVCRDEADYVRRKQNRDTGTVPRPVERALTLTRRGDAELRLRKETRWARGEAGAPASAVALSAERADSAGVATSSTGATLKLEVLPGPRWRNSDVRQRARMRGHLDPVRIDTAVAVAAVRGHRRRERCVALIRWLARRLFGCGLCRERQPLREVRLLVDRAPPDGLAPVVTRVGTDWRVCESSQPLWSGIVRGAGLVRRDAERLARRSFARSGPAAVPCAEVDQVRLY